jgi:exosortase N
MNASLILALIALMYTPHFQRKPTPGFRFGWISLGLTAIFYFQGFKTVGLAALVFALCLFQENFYRRIAPATLLILLLATPALGWFADNFSFPLRLQLTELAGNLMLKAGFSVTTDGNLITYGSHTFSVDPVCMGLHMMIDSLLCCMLLINYYQGQYSKRLPLWAMLAALSGTILLNIVANLFRIIGLVLMVIPEDNPMHGILGLLILCIYVLLPLIPGLRWMIRHFGKHVPLEAARFRISSPLALVANCVVFVCLFIATIFIWTKPPRPVPTVADISGYTVHPLQTGIVQLENEHSLVYIKPIPAFCYTGHSPNICWQGSGYTFSNLKQTNAWGTRIYEGTMKKEKETLYTAWWYDNGVQQTIDPFSWRWDQLLGAPGYSIVNITAATPEELDTEVNRALEKHTFRKLLAQAH